MPATRAGAADEVGAGGQHGAHGGDGDDRLAGADQRVGAEHRRQDGARAARCRRSPARARSAVAPAITASQAPTAAIGRIAPRREPARATCISPPTSSAPITPMLRMFAPSAVMPAVGEHERLHAEHDRQRQAGEPGPEQDRRQRGAEEVAARAARDREVEHLRGEDERGGDAEQRDAALVEVDVRPCAGRRRRRPRPGRRTRARPRWSGSRQGCAWLPPGMRRRRRRSGSG